MTNIHGGWVKSVEEIAKNMKKDSLNRVILLTDGQANTGKTNPDDICVDVSRIANKNISTSTFGIGCGFNELLLSSMSQTGLGNFYFIKIFIPIIVGFIIVWCTPTDVIFNLKNFNF